jgi:hypothetical protein
MTSALFGIPAENVYNLFRGTVGNVGDISGHPVDWATDETDTANGLIAAWENGHYDTAKEKQDRLIADKMRDGKTEDEARDWMRGKIQNTYKARYVDAAYRRDEKETERIRNILEESGLFDDVNETLEDWENKDLAKRLEDEIGSVAEITRDMADAMRHGDWKAGIDIGAGIDRWYELKLQSYLRQGLDQEEAEKKARSAVKSSVSEVLKPLWKNGEQDLVREITGQIFVGGEMLYRNYNFKAWDK